MNLSKKYLGTIDRLLSSTSKRALLFRWILGREPTDETLYELSKGSTNIREFIWKILLTKEGLDHFCKEAMDLHLFLIHNARLKAIRLLIPSGNIILDLGGAASPLYRMGYPYLFEKLSIIDLPSDQRYIDYKEVHLEYYGQGEVTVCYNSMTDLSDFSDASVDLVWSGQSIEHITIDDGKKMCSEAYRVLKKGGYFCLDTPNRLITSIHTGDPEVMINPDHKFEYTPVELRSILKNEHFDIVNEKGICEMPKTAETGQFTYEDFVLGSPISNNIDSSYIMFFVCQKFS